MGELCTNLSWLYCIYPPEDVRNNENVTLHFKLEKVSMKELSRGKTDTIRIQWTSPDVAQRSMYKNFTPPEDVYRYMFLSRDVSVEDVEAQKLVVMPGFSFSWWYTGAKVIPENKYKDEEITQHFVRYESEFETYIEY